MAAREVVRTLTVRSRQEGVPEVTRSLHGLADAHREVSRAATETAVVEDRSASKLRTVERGWQGLTGRLEGNTAAYRSFIRESNYARQALDAGLTSVGRYKEVIGQLRQELQAASSGRMGFAVDQSELNELLGIRTKLSGSARESASVFEDEARLMEGLQVKASRLRAELDPLGAAYERLNKELADHQTLADRQLISQDELAQATQRARQAFDQTAASLKPVNDNVKLSAFQVQNLGFQLNDAVTMLLSGSSPFQVMATQGGQVVQALGDNPGGVRGSLRAMFDVAKSALSFITPGGWVVAGFTAAAAAATLFGTKAEDRMERANKAAAGFGTTLDTIRKSNAELADSIEQIANAAERLSPTDTANKMAADIKAQQKAIAEARQGAGQAALSTGGWNPLYGPREAIGMATGGFTQTSLADLADGFLRGSKTAKTLRSEILALQAAGSVPSYLQPAVQQVLDFADAAIKAQGEIDGLEKGLRRMQVAAGQLRFDEASKKLAGLLPDVSQAEQIERTYREVLGSIAQMPGADKAIDRDGLRETARRQRDEALAELGRPARESLKVVQDSLANFDLSPVQKQIAETTQAYDARIAEYARTTKDAAGLADLQREKEAALALVTKEATRAEEARRAGYALDLKAVNDQTAAQQAATAGQRAYNEAIAAGYDKSYASARSAEASTLSFAEAERTAADAVREAQTARDQAGLEGYAGQVAAINASYAEQIRLADGSAAAIASLTRARQLELETLDINVRRELLGAQEDELRLLQAEAGLIGANDQVRRSALATIQAELDLKRRGIDINSELGQTYLTQARQIADAQNAIDKQTESFEALRDVAQDFIQSLGSGKGILEGLLNALAGFSSKFVSLGLDKLLGGGTGTGGIASVPQAISAAASKLPTYGANSAPDQTYAAPVGAVERRVLPALGKATDSLSAAAKAIRTIESGSAGGNYSAMGPVTRTGDRAYGAYQVMGANIPQWSKAAVGRIVSNVEFLSSRDIQDAVFNHRFGGYIQKYGPEGASRAWFAGEGGMRNYKAQDVVGTSVSGYGSRFGSLYAQHSNDNTPVSSRAIENATAKGTERGYTKAAESYSNGGYDATYAGSSSTGRLQGLLKSPFGQGAMNALGAFSAGASGGPISGALSGGLGAIGMGLGPVGIGLGVLAGIGGSLAKNLFNKKEREAAHRQAESNWIQQQPAYEAFKRSLTGEGQGKFREKFSGQWGQLSGFMKAGGDAWKYGTGNSTAEFASTGTIMFQKAIKEMAEFRNEFNQTVKDVAAGLGANSPYAKGTEAIKTLRTQYQSALDDVEIAFGKADNGFPVAGLSLAWEEQLQKEREAAVASFKRASIDNALGLLDIAKPMSEASEAIDGFRGIAARLPDVLKEMGLSAEEAARAVDERFNAVLAKMRTKFEVGIEDEVNELDGKGYLAQVREMIEAFQTTKDDAAQFGADTSLLPRLFELRAQAIVDAAQLTGSAFDELVAKFPELKGVVKEFAENVTITAAQLKENYASFLDTRLSELTSERAEAEGTLRTELERSVSFIESLKDFTAGLKLDSNLSTLSAKDQFAEAQRVYRETMFKAAGGDKDAQDKLIGSAQDYLDQAKGYYASSEEYGAVFDEVNSTLTATATKAQSAVDLARDQVSVLRNIDESTKGLSELVKTWLEKDAAVDKVQKQIDGGRTFGINTERNRLIDAGIKQVGLSYTGNYGIVNGADPFLQWRSSLPAEQRAVVEGIINQYIGINRASGGPVWGPGTSTSDSIRANLSNGEFVLREAAARSFGYDNLGHMNRTGTLPPAMMPTLAIPTTMRPAGNDTTALERQVEALAAEVSRLGAIIHASDEETRTVIRQGNRSQKKAADALELDAA